MVCNEECKKKCNKQSECTCMCEIDESTENCDDCINEDSIDFSGICIPDEFEVNTNYWIEFPVVGTIAIPEEKPSIEEVDKISINVQILSQKTIITPKGPNGPVVNYEGKTSTGKKLIIEGLICFNTSYVSLTSEQRVHSFIGQIPFSTFIVLPASICVDYKYLIDKCVEEVCVKRVCDRTIDLAVSLLIKATPIQNSCDDDDSMDCNKEGISTCNGKQCATDKPDIKGICKVDKIVDLLKDEGKEWTEISIPELLTIPCAKPDIKQIVSINSRIEIMCQKVIGTPIALTGNYEGVKLSGFKLLIHALLRQRITYISTLECGSVHSAHYDMPISAYIVLQPNSPGNINTNFTDRFKIKTCIEDIYACPLNERQIFKNTTLFLKAEPIGSC